MQGRDSEVGTVGSVKPGNLQMCQVNTCIMLFTLEDVRTISMSMMKKVHIDSYQTNHFQRPLQLQLKHQTQP